MSLGATKRSDLVMASGSHVELPLVLPRRLAPTCFTHRISGIIDVALGSSSNLMSLPDSLVMSKATGTPPQRSFSSGTTFVLASPNCGPITLEDEAILIDGLQVADDGSTVLASNGPVDSSVRTVVVSGTIMVGG